MLKFIIIKIALKIEETIRNINNLSAKEFTTKLLILTSITLNLITIYMAYS